MYLKRDLVPKASLTIFFAALLLIPIVQAYSFTNGQEAAIVIGQPDFSSNFASVSANGLTNPVNVAIDADGNLWVTDTFAHRVLRYDAPFSNGEAATLVIGQSSFTTGTLADPPTASSLQDPRGIALDNSGNLWIADAGNHRVLRYDAPFSNGQAATLVIGQSNLVSDIIASPPTERSLNNPIDITFDGAGNLWVVDSSDNRVLRYDAPFSNNQAAALVLGQTTFTSNSNNAGGLSASSLSSPVGLDIDSSNNLWVADRSNNRVLRYESPFVNGELATLVLGQTTFTSNSNNAGGLSASSLSAPDDVDVDVAGNVLVVDQFNHRLLRYEQPTTNGEAATLVLGQNQFTSSQTTATPNANLLKDPFAAVFDSTGNIWTADFSNRRVIMFSATVSGSQVTGQVTIAETCGLDTVSGSPISYGTLVPGALSAEQTLVLENTGSADATLTVTGTDWVDGALTSQIAVGNTRFSTTVGTDYFTKTQLTTSDQFVSIITPTADLNTYWQLEANLLDSSFAGTLTQTMDFTASC